MVANTATTIFRRMIDPVEGDLPEPAAQFMLRLDFTPADHQRMEELSSKAARGELTADEQRELDDYLHVSDLLAFIQSKARGSLKRSGLQR